MLLTKEISIKVSGNRNLKHFESKGYVVPYLKDDWNRLRVAPNSYLIIKTEDLPSTSREKVKVLCDYCNQEIIEKEYQRYNKENTNSVVKKDCCKKCSSKKQEEVMMALYGVPHIMNLQETKNKVQNTNMERHGVKMPMQNHSIKMKQHKTNIERYGSISPLTNDLVHEKTIATNQRNYGVDNVFSSQIIKDKIRSTLYENGNAPCSCQQEYLHLLLGGYLNYPMFNYSLDIAFKEEFIYLEYDGNGHDLQVQMGNITNEEFKVAERNRYYFLKNRGWRGIRFISLKNRFPSDEIIVNLINKAKDYFKEGHTWFEIDIDNEELRCSQYVEKVDFGKLTWIKKHHLEKFN